MRRSIPVKDLSFPTTRPGAEESQKRRDASRRERESLRERIFATETHDEVLDILAQNRLSRYVDDYHSYLKWRREGLEEGESPGIILQSLQSWIWFLISYAEPARLPYAMIDADHDGCIELEWRLSAESDGSDPDDAYWGNALRLRQVRPPPAVASGAKKASLCCDSTRPV